MIIKVSIFGLVLAKRENHKITCRFSEMLVQKIYKQYTILNVCFERILLPSKKIENDLSFTLLSTSHYSPVLTRIFSGAGVQRSRAEGRREPVRVYDLVNHGLRQAGRRQQQMWQRAGLSARHYGDRGGIQSHRRNELVNN